MSPCAPMHVAIDGRQNYIWLPEEIAVPHNARGTIKPVTRDRLSSKPDRSHLFPDVHHTSTRTVRKRKRAPKPTWPFATVAHRGICISSRAAVRGRHPCVATAGDAIPAPESCRASRQLQQTENSLLSIPSMALVQIGIHLSNPHHAELWHRVGRLDRRVGFSNGMAAGTARPGSRDQQDGQASTRQCPDVISRHRQ